MGTKRDTRSYDIKRAIKKKYPGATVKVKKNSSSMSTSFKVKTDVLPTLDRTDCDINSGCITAGENISNEEYWNRREKIDNYHSIKRELKQLLKDYQKVNRCNVTHEILSGGNTYLFIEAL